MDREFLAGFSPEHRDLIKSWELVGAKAMPNGQLYGVHRFLYTFGILENIQEMQYGNRWCYPDPYNAILALHQWDGTNEPPGPWLRGKGIRLDRWNELVYRKGPNGLFELIPDSERDWAKIWPSP